MRQGWDIKNISALDNFFPALDFKISVEINYTLMLIAIIICNAFCVHSLLQCFVQIIMRWDYFEVCNCDQSEMIGNEVTRETKFK